MPDKIFLDLVKIDSISGEEEKVARYITSFLTKLKIEVKRDKAGNVIAYVPGKGRPLMLNAHMDTVEPGRGVKPLVKNGIITSDGRTILGADCKAGVAAILKAAETVVRNKIAVRPLELVFTREEETTLGGATNLNAKLIKSKEALVLDRSRPVGTIVLASPNCYFLDIKVFGRSAHAGSEPEKGINAIKIAADAIAGIKLGRVSKGLTCNFGVIQGGHAANIIPDEITLKGEVRGIDIREAQRQVDIIADTFKKSVRKHRGRLNFKVRLACSGYEYSPTHKFVQQIISVNKKLHLKTITEIAGGASDANVFKKKKIMALVLGDGSEAVHTTKERIKIKELKRLAEFLVEFVKI